MSGALWGAYQGASLGADAIDAGLLDQLEGRRLRHPDRDDLYEVFAAGGEPSTERYPAG